MTGDGCVHSTVLDLVKWGAALQRDHPLPEPQRAKLFAPHSELREGLQYGYGWFLSQKHSRSVAHHSGAGEGVIVEMELFADEGLSIIVLANYAPAVGIRRRNKPGRGLVVLGEPVPKEATS